jgi:hypothetical protein
LFRKPIRNPTGFWESHLEVSEESEVAVIGLTKLVDISRQDCMIFSMKHRITSQISV